MGSIDAKQVGIKVCEKLRKGQKVKLGQIMIEQGYSKSTSVHPKSVTETKSYQEVINPVVKRWEKIRNGLTKALEGKDLTKEKTIVIIDSIDKLTKNIQLLSGGKTEDHGLDKHIESLNILMNQIKNKR